MMAWTIIAATAFVSGCGVAAYATLLKTPKVVAECAEVTKQFARTPSSFRIYEYNDYYIIRTALIKYEASNAYGAKIGGTGRCVFDEKNALSEYSIDGSEDAKTLSLANTFLASYRAGF
ncbi:MAG: hypothetical protein OJJ21_16910 [Ferrovibrio sp.]|uniref:hypothetical protein n=1 Tax=Ferrovibrio sp. TaxID=1917215 RepID=UPI0026120EBF|nr:hypothetical protein [Ferrovibrio sp.]MCW0235282.1 hypothetical protein [Ferrovibrio sp.]